MMGSVMMDAVGIDVKAITECILTVVILIEQTRMTTL